MELNSVLSHISIFNGFWFLMALPPIVLAIYNFGKHVQKRNSFPEHDNIRLLDLPDNYVESNNFTSLEKGAVAQMREVIESVTKFK